MEYDIGGKTKLIQHSDFLGEVFGAAKAREMFSIPTNGHHPELRLIIRASSSPI